MTIPPHTSHVLQPIDLVFASTFKRHFTVLHQIKCREAARSTDKMTRGDKLLDIASSAVAAHNLAVTDDAPESSWNRARLLPHNVSKLLTSGRMIAPSSSEEATRALQKYLESVEKGHGGGILTDPNGPVFGKRTTTPDVDIAEDDLENAVENCASEAQSGASNEAPTKKRKRKGIVLKKFVAGDGETLYRIDLRYGEHTRTRILSEDEISPVSLAEFQQ